MHVWSTSQVADRESFAFWNDAVCDAFLRVRTERSARRSFRGKIGSIALGAVTVNRVDSESHLVARHRAEVAKDAHASFFVNFHHLGPCLLAQAGREHAVAPGEIGFHDSARPFDLLFPEDMRLTSFIVPRAALIARVGDTDAALARPLPSTVEAQVFRRFIASLAEAHTTLAGSTRAQEMGTIFVDLLALALGPNASGRENARPSARRVLFATVCARIRAQLSDPSLDLDRVAAMTGLARRTLQTLFREHGATFTHYVLEQRLLLAERQLANGRASVTEVAYATGFSDLSYFCRVFQSRFGMTAGERRAGR